MEIVMGNREVIAECIAGYTPLEAVSNSGRGIEYGTYIRHTEDFVLIRVANEDLCFDFECWEFAIALFGPA
jgi:hypothetical protein